MAKHESAEAHPGVEACSGAKRLRILRLVDFLTMTTNLTRSQLTKYRIQNLEGVLLKHLRRCLFDLIQLTSSTNLRMH
jgi:hypothetical protein